MRIPVGDVDHKLDVIDHVNQDHTEELMAIARGYYLQGSVQSAKLSDIFEDGVELEIHRETDRIPELLFVPFEIDGSLEDKILYLAFAAVVKQGRDFGGSGRRFFEVIAKQDVTENIARLTIHSTSPLPDYYPGYAYAFLLKSVTKRPVKASSENGKKTWSKNLIDRGFIWLLKHLSGKNRQKLLESANKDIRLYTLRKSWKSQSSAFADQGYIDIFKHGDTRGSQWIRELCVGDIIQSRSETPDRHPHLSEGKATLIADETAYPALAGILEHWQNKIPPNIILLSKDKADQDYFGEGFVLGTAAVHRVICPVDKQGSETLRILETIEQIDVVWAALESASAKMIRRYLRSERQIPGKHNHTKAYWSLKSRRGQNPPV